MTIRTGNKISFDFTSTKDVQEVIDFLNLHGCLVAPTKRDAVKNNKAKISDFADRIQKLLDAHAKGMGPYADPPLISINWGRRYAKIVRTDNQRSVYGFVDIASGDILKAASWSGPAKHIRGNINNPDKGMGACTPWGITYLR